MTLWAIHAELQLLAPVKFRRFSGLAARALLYRLVKGALHDSPKPKPLSVSPLLRGGRPLLRGDFVEAGEAVAVRFVVAGQYVRDVVANMERAEVEGARAELLRYELQPIRVGGDPLSRFTLRFLTPVRFKRGRIFDPIPQPHSLALSAGLHAARALGSASREVLGFSASEGPVRRVAAWAYGYVAVAKASLRTAVVYADGAPQVGSVGWATYEVKGRRGARHFWALVQYGAAVGFGDGKTYGLGYAELVPAAGREVAEVVAYEGASG